MQFRIAVPAALCSLVFFAGGALAQTHSASSGQAWPSKPVRIINPFPAGGGVDTFARPLSVKLTKQFGQTFFVENQGGAGGTVGATNASRQAPDGYVLFAGAVHHTIAETLYTKLPYSLERDFIPVTVLSYVPNVIVMHPKYPFKSVSDLIAYSKANPGKLNFGSAGNGTTHHLAGELFMLTTDTKLTHVPYKGAGPMMQDLLAGQVDMAFDGMGTSAVQIKAGKLKPLAVTTATRSPVIPEVPTMKEAGFPNYQVTTWYALWAIKGTPKDIVDRVYAETAKVLHDQDMKDIWASQGATAGGQPPAEFAKFVHSEIEKWGKVVKEAKIQIDL